MNGAEATRIRLPTIGDANWNYRAPYTSISLSKHLK